MTMDNIYTIIALMGKAGSGKDTIMRALLKQPAFKDAAPIISCTTRPKREHEKDGVDYHFLSREDFAKKVLENKFLEVAEFNDWFYGTLKEDLKTDKINISVLNPEGIENILLHKDIDLKVYYVDVPGRIRICRQLMREQNPDIPEIFRRYVTDDEDFFLLPFEHTVLRNETNEDFIQSVQRIYLDSIRWTKYDKIP